jgi:predicted TIM-barrel enzyme
MDVVCTSGSATGVPADLTKIRVMSDTLTENTALAIASGITAENISSYLPYVEAFLVGTGLEKEFGVFDPAKVKAVARAIESYTP